MKNYNFGEKTTEKWKNSKTGTWDELKVWQTPKYEQSKKKAIELIESGKYGLDIGDFWILKNKGGTKLCYTGLIISHNGCLKINDKLDVELRFKPSCVSFVKDEAEKVKVMEYVNDPQGVYEFGEISPKNCMNDYPYAMVLKRLMDRVILKNSKVGFFGIYSDSESEDFKEKIDDKIEKQEKVVKTPLQNVADGCSDDMKNIQNKQAEITFREIKEEIEACSSVSDLQNSWLSNKKSINKLMKYHENLFCLLESAKDDLKRGLSLKNELDQPN